MLSYTEWLIKSPVGAGRQVTPTSFSSQSTKPNEGAEKGQERFPLRPGCPRACWRGPDRIGHLLPNPYIGYHELVWKGGWS